MLQRRHRRAHSNPLPQTVGFGTATTLPTDRFACKPPALSVLNSHKVKSADAAEGLLGVIEQTRRHRIAPALPYSVFQSVLASSPGAGPNRRESTAIRLDEDQLLGLLFSSSGAQASRIGQRVAIILSHGLMLVFVVLAIFVAGVIAVARN